MVENHQSLSKWLWNGSHWLAEDADYPLLYERRQCGWKIYWSYGHNKGHWHHVLCQLWRKAQENLPTHHPCQKCRDSTLCIEARQGICQGLLHPTLPTGRGGQIQRYISWTHYCQPHLMSSQVGNCRVCQTKPTRSDRLYKPSSLGNGSGQSRRNSKQDCRKKMKCICYRAHMQPPLCPKDPDTTITIPSSHWSSSHSCLTHSYTPSSNPPQKPMKGRDVLSFLEKHDWPLVNQLDEATSDTPWYAMKYTSLKNFHPWLRMIEVSPDLMEDLCKCPPRMLTGLLRIYKVLPDSKKPLLANLKTSLSSLL